MFSDMDVQGLIDLQGYIFFQNRDGILKWTHELFNMHAQFVTLPSKKKMLVNFQRTIPK